MGVSDLLVELKELAAGMDADSSHASEQNMASKICLLSLKFDSDNIDVARRLTTEGLRLNQRVEYLQKLSNIVETELFEFSTCNRVLYIGFDIEPETLAAGISKMVGVEDIPFVQMTGSDAWKHLVKVCSGLDSFIVGELQVMSQFRSSINFHRENNLIGTYNLAFFDHVISANRIIRKELGYTSSTESMLKLARTKLLEIVSKKETTQSVVLGFGDMGVKAVETLDEMGQSEIIVASRNPQKSVKRNQELANRCKMITYDDIDAYIENADIVISTMRCSTPAYHKNKPLHMNKSGIVLDFSWPPSIEPEALTERQTLLSMEQWIQLARNINDAEYRALVEKSEQLIDNIMKRYMEALSNKAQGKFRALIYNHMENLSTSWESSSVAQQKDIPQLGAFAREIATWICKQDESFHLSDLTSYVKNTTRGFNSNLLEQVSQDVEQSIRTLTSIG